MKIIYTPSAVRQIDELLAYIEERNPQGARRVNDRIKSTIEMLARHPMAGHPTDTPGRRRIVTGAYPYAIFYRVHDGALIIQRVRHTARRPLG